jgi:hypothetical protein
MLLWDKWVPPKRNERSVTYEESSSGSEVRREGAAGCRVQGG